MKYTQTRNDHKSTAYSVQRWKSQTFAKVSRLFGSQIFFLEIFKIHRLVWIFLWFFVVVLNLFHQKI